MDSYEIIHDIGVADFTGYTYFQIYVEAGLTLKYKGVDVTPPTTSIILNLAVSSYEDISGSDTKIMLLGKKRPELTTSYNSDGTWNIR